MESRQLMLLAASICCGLVVWWVVSRTRSPFAAAGLALITIAAVFSGLTFLSRPVNPNAPAAQSDGPRAQDWASIELAQLRPVRPVRQNINSYVSSQSCQECHPHNHATWAASYHRTMTQVATPTAVIGDFDNVEVMAQGRTYRLSRQRDVCWVDMDDPDAPAGTQRVTVPIVLTTGSHHMQVYWYATGRSRTVGQLPIAFLKETQRWVPRDALFLSPPAPFGSETGRWNKTCIACHATHGQPRPKPQGEWDSRVGEFGIACEACHGPAERHVELRRGETLESGLDDPIVNPAHLPHDRASQVCGQCHSINTPLDTPKFIAAQINGESFRPGNDLSESRLVVRENKESRAHLQRFIGDEVDQYMIDQFWPDGMVRISGRELNGLVESACYQRGSLSCLTCHDLHPEEDDPRPLSEWANDQLHPRADGDATCLDCHESGRYDTGHTHHATDSMGSRCVNCHMPHTTYGLLKAIRSHEITSPSVLRDDIAAARPNACNLCHLDQTARWTAEHLQRWFGAEVPQLSKDQEDVASSLLWLLKGDAGQRALTAWSMGWKPALEAAGDEWQAPFLACLLDDPYDAVRFMAQRSLKQLPGFTDFVYDYVGNPADRPRAREQAIQIWHARRTAASRHAPQLLIDQNNRLRIETLSHLLRQRDDRPVTLAE